MFINFKDEPWDTKTKIAATTLTLVIIISAAMQYANWKNGDKNRTADTVVIGGAFGLSGNCAAWGEGEFEAAKLAIADINATGGINGKDLEMVVEDTQCENKTTVNAVNKLVHADKVFAVIGPTWGDAYQGAAAVLREANIVGVSPDTAMEALELQNEPVDFIFSTYPPQRAEIAALQGYAAKKPGRKIAMVWDQDSYSTMMTKLFREAAMSNGLTIGSEHELPTGNQDFRTIIAKIKKENPYGIFISFLAPHTKASFLKQAKELGVPSVILSAADIQDESVLESFGEYMDGVIYTYPKPAAGQEAFTEKYRAAYGKDPQGPAAANAYDAVRIVAEALKSGARSGEEIQKALMEIEMPGTFIETLDFNDMHQVHGGEFEVKTVRGGTFTAL